MPRSLVAPAVTGPVGLLEPALVVFVEAVDDDDDEAAIPVDCKPEAEKLELVDAELVADGVEDGDGRELADAAEVPEAAEPLVTNVAELSVVPGGVVSEDVVSEEVDPEEDEDEADGEPDDEGDALVPALTPVAVGLLLLLLLLEDVDWIELGETEPLDTNVGVSEVEKVLDEDADDVGMIADTDVPVCCAEVTTCADEDRSAAAEVLVEGEVVSDSSQKSMYCWNWPSRYVRVVSLPDEPLLSTHRLQPV